MNSQLTIKDNMVDENNKFTYASVFGSLISISNNYGNIKHIFSSNMTIQVDGVVEALYYVHGYTTQEEWNRLWYKAKDPIFDFDAENIKFLGQRRNIWGRACSYKVMEFYNKSSYMSTWANVAEVNPLLPNRINFTNFIRGGEQFV